MDALTNGIMDAIGWRAVDVVEAICQPPVAQVEWLVTFGAAAVADIMVLDFH